MSFKRSSTPLESVLRSDKKELHTLEQILIKVLDKEPLAEPLAEEPLSQRSPIATEPLLLRSSYGAPCSGAPYEGPLQGAPHH